MNRRSVLAMGAVAVLLGSLHCYTGAESCPKHQWGYTLAIDDTNMDEEFDGECINVAHFPMEPDLPPSGSIRGSTTVTHEEHEAVEAVVAAIQAADWSGVLPGQVDLYLDVVHNSDLQIGAIDTHAWHECLEWLESQGCIVTNPQTDPDGQGAWDICWDFVHNPIRDILTDIDGCDGWEAPTKDPLVHGVTDPFECDFQPGYTDDGGGAGMCFGEDGPATGGAMADGDETGAEAEPFGDVTQLIDCAPLQSYEQYCTYDQSLLATVAAKFHVFHDEGVWLEAKNISGAGRGVQISGLDSGEASKEFFDRFDIQNEDHLTHVNSVALTSSSAILDAIMAFEDGSTTTWTLTIRRKNGWTWDTLDYYVTPAVSFAP
jgi:hypothetical protein